MEDEDLLKHARILDTAGDIVTLFVVRCSSCNHSLDIADIIEEPEVGIIIETKECYICTESAHTRGYFEGQDESRGW